MSCSRRGLQFKKLSEFDPSVREICTISTVILRCSFQIFINTVETQVKEHYFQRKPESILIARISFKLPLVPKRLIEKGNFYELEMQGMCSRQHIFRKEPCWLPKNRHKQKSP